MRFPASERIQFAINPLEEVICQVKFPTILKIATESPAAFQERVRRDHPIYRRQQDPVLPPGVSAALGGIQLPSSAEAVTHWFDSEDGTRSVSLAPQFVAVTDRNYTTWERFRSVVDRAVDALCETYAPVFFERVGLKYVDVIDRAALSLGDRPWSELLEGPIAGMAAVSENLVSGLEQSHSIARLSLDEPQGSAVLLQSGLMADGRFAIEADFFIEGRKDKDGAAAALEIYNREAGRLFRWAIREPVFDALGRLDT